MGKGSRLKAERRAATDAEVPHARLLTAVQIIGDSFGSRVDCAAAAAMLKLTAQGLGYDLTPQPVSLLARQHSTDYIAFMGPRATALISEEDRARAEDHREGNGDTGHMVLTSEEPLMMFDPNIGQLRAREMWAPNSIAMEIDSIEPSSGEWKFDLPDLTLRYFPDDNPALWDRYEGGLVGHKDHAERLVALIKSGRTVAQIKATLMGG